MTERYYSLDVFRGATVALMILVINPGSWSFIYSPLEHAAWHGCTPADLVFPFFLFAVGNAMAFVLPKLEEGKSSVFFRKVTTRFLLIFGIGLFLNWSPFIQWKDNHIIGKPWETIRILGVLQRIAIAYFLASLVVYFATKKQVWLLSIIVLLTYWGLCYFLGLPDDPYSFQGYFGTRVDQAILGASHMYKGEGVPFEPEGLASALPTIVQVLFGYLAGRFIIEKGKTWEMLSHLLIGGVLFVFIGFAWDVIFPINKKIWSSSYVVYTTGLAMVTLGFLIFIIELKNNRGLWSKFFDVFGKNPLFIFALHVLLMRTQALIRIQDHFDDKNNPVYSAPLTWFYKHLCDPISTDPRTGSLIYAVVMILFYWVIVFIMDRRKIYIKV